MAYIVGILDEDEERELERRGWEIEPAPAELVPKPGEEGSERADRYKMVWVDTSMFDVMNGPDWDKGPGWDKGGG